MSVSCKISNIILPSFIFFGLLFCMSAVAQNNLSDTVQENRFKNSFSTDPLLPVFNSFALVYEHRSNSASGWILGFWYGKTTSTYPGMIEYPGYIRNYSPILAYRRYFWRNLHAEYQIYPGYSRFYEAEVSKYHNSFSVFNELRVGYKFNFRIRSLPLMLNLQWPLGFTIYESNEPESFREIRKQDPLFYIIFPNIYLGFRF
jgi:hypothetical protein